MSKRAAFLTILILPLVAAGTIAAQDTTYAEIPDWVHEHWTRLAADGHVWIADNSEFKSEQEPYDEYGLAFSYGLGKQSLKGRLFAVVDGKRAGAFWTFTAYWDPEEQILSELQLGTDGTVGVGRTWQVNDSTVRNEMTFRTPGGGGYSVGHETTWIDGDKHSQSFSIDENGEWSKQRFYIWRQGE